VLFLDALVLTICEGGSVQRRACYLALGVTVEGERHRLGRWFQQSDARSRPPSVAPTVLCAVAADGLKERRRVAPSIANSSLA
jgi:transposase-like protein